MNKSLLVFGLSAFVAYFAQAQTYALLKEFSGSDGAAPVAVILSGNTLYGTTASGGSNGNSGTVFKVNTDGTSFTVLKEFSGSDGANPSGGLTLSGDTLYGTTDKGGSSGSGTVFMMNKDGTGYTLLKEFSGSDGANPNGNLTLSGNTLYGTTKKGGSVGDNGTVFKVNTDGTGFTVLKEFTGTDGWNPQAGLTLSGNTLYGTTANGGSFGGSGIGTVFKVNTDGTGFTVLKDFTNWFDGAYPHGGLTVSGNTLYGTTFGIGDYSVNYGTVFKVNTDGTGFIVLKAFTVPGDAIDPNSGVTLSGNTLYGITIGGGSAADGTVFKVNTDGTGYTLLKNFTGSDGKMPFSVLTLSGNTLYGTTIGGGSADSGTVFALALTAPPSISTQPVDLAVVLSSNGTFTVAATGTTPLSYQWRFGGLPLVDGAIISGTTSNIITLSGVNPSHAGYYDVVITNNYGAVTSSVASLTVTGLPLAILATKGALMYTNGQFQFTLTAPAGSNAVIEASTDMQTWVPISTNLVPLGVLNFTDVTANNFPMRFYRTVPQ